MDMNAEHRPKQGAGPSFPLSRIWFYGIVLYRGPEQKAWGRVRNPQTYISNKKREGQPFLHLKWLGFGQNRWLANLEGLFMAFFGRCIPPECDYYTLHSPAFCPYFYLGRGSWPPFAFNLQWQMAKPRPYVRGELLHARHFKFQNLFQSRVGNGRVVRIGALELT
jgi:hypothetical protein